MDQSASIVRRTTRRHPGLRIALLALALLGACQSGFPLSERYAAEASRSAADQAGLAAPDAGASSSGAGSPGASTGRWAEDANTALPTSQDPTAAGSAEPGAAARDRRKLIRSGQLGIDVSNPAAAIERFTALVESAGGYVQERRDEWLLARIPAERFEAVFAATRALGAVRSQSLEVADVTEQHRDLEIRLANARAARERVLALLQRAEQIDDVLALERELQRLTTEVERLTAQLEGLQPRIALSDLQVTFHGPPELTAPRLGRRPSRFPWIDRVGPNRLLEDF